MPEPSNKKKLPAMSPRPGFRLHNPTTSEVDYSAEEAEFMAAMEAYKRSHRRPFPTCREVLAVVKSLGYSRHATEIDFLASDGVLGCDDGE